MYIKYLTKKYLKKHSEGLAPSDCIQQDRLFTFEYDASLESQLSDRRDDILSSLFVLICFFLLTINLCQN